METAFEHRFIHDYPSPASCIGIEPGDTMQGKDIIGLGHFGTSRQLLSPPLSQRNQSSQHLHDMHSPIQFEQPEKSPTWSDSCYGSISASPYWTSTAGTSPAVSAEHIPSSLPCVIWPNTYPAPLMVRGYTPPSNDHLDGKAMILSNSTQVDFAPYPGMFSVPTPAPSTVGLSPSPRLSQATSRMLDGTYGHLGEYSLDEWIAIPSEHEYAEVVPKMEPAPFDYTPLHVLPSNAAVDESLEDLESEVSDDDDFDQKAQVSCGTSKSKAAFWTKKRQRQYATEEKHSGQCDQCHRYFTRPGNLKAHRKKHDPNRPRAHACLETGCGKSFERLTDLRRHAESVHVAERKYQCHMCSRGFKRRDILARHERDGCEHLPSKRRAKHKASRT